VRSVSEERLCQSVSVACDIELTFTTDSNAPWFLQTEEYYYDGDAVQSKELKETPGALSGA
jgi:hypothetical protein